MSRQILIDTIIENAGITEKEAKAVIANFTNGIQKAMQKGDEILLIGFGKFSVKSSLARKGRNPMTGEAIDIAASKSVKFTVGKNLKSAVNQ